MFRKVVTLNGSGTARTEGAEASVRQFLDERVSIGPGRRNSGIGYRLFGLGVLAITLGSTLFGFGLAKTVLAPLPATFVLAFVFGGTWFSHGFRSTCLAFFPYRFGKQALSIQNARRIVRARSRARSLAFGAGVVGLLLGALMISSASGGAELQREALRFGLLAPLWGSLLAWLVFSGRCEALGRR